MRKVIASEFVTLDGVMEGPGSNDPFERAGWSMAYWDEAIGKLKFDELFASDALLLGRVTYQGFAAAWPSMTDEMGGAAALSSRRVAMFRSDTRSRPRGLEATRDVQKHQDAIQL